MRIITVDGPAHLDVASYAQILAATLTLRCLEAGTGVAIPLQGAVVVRGGSCYSEGEVVKLFLRPDESTVVPEGSYAYDVYKHSSVEEASYCLAQLYYLVVGRRALGSQRVVA